MTMHISERSPRERRFKGIGVFVGSQLNQQKRKKVTQGIRKLVGRWASRTDKQGDFVREKMDVFVSYESLSK